LLDSIMFCPDTCRLVGVSTFVHVRMALFVLVVVLVKVMATTTTITRTRHWSNVGCVWNIH
jgi:hypothetical protein